MHRAAVGALAGLAIVMACAGNSTSLVNSWTAPDPTPWEFHRTLVTFVSTDQPTRHAVEDRLATRIPGSFAAYASVPGLSVDDPRAARTQLRGKLFDGAVVVRVLGLRGDQSTLPGSGGYAAYPGFYHYWASSWAALRDPAYVAPDSQVQVEIVVYSVTQDRLLWAGRTTTLNPKSIQEAVDHSVDVAAKSLASKRAFQ